MMRGPVLARHRSTLARQRSHHRRWRVLRRRMPRQIAEQIAGPVQREDDLLALGRDLHLLARRPRARCRSSAPARWRARWSRRARSSARPRSAVEPRRLVEPGERVHATKGLDVDGHVTTSAARPRSPPPCRPSSLRHRLGARALGPPRLEVRLARPCDERRRRARPDDAALVSATASGMSVATTGSPAARYSRSLSGLALSRQRVLDERQERHVEGLAVAGQRLVGAAPEEVHVGQRVQPLKAGVVGVVDVADQHQRALRDRPRQLRRIASRSTHSATRP